MCLVISTNLHINLMYWTYNFEIPYQVTISSREEWLSEKYIEKGDTKFFTDSSSKTEHGTGFGIDGEFVVEKNFINTAATVFQAEAKAITYCAELIYNRGAKDKEIYILIYWQWISLKSNK